MSQQPCVSQLGHCMAAGLSPASQALDSVKVRGSHVSLNVAARLAARSRGRGSVASILTGEETPSQGEVGQHAHAEGIAVREYLLFDATF